MEIKFINITNLDPKYANEDNSKSIKLFYKFSIFRSVLITNHSIDLKFVNQTFYKINGKQLCVVFLPESQESDFFIAVGIDYKLFKNNLTLDRPIFDRYIETIIGRFVVDNNDLLNKLNIEFTRLTKLIKIHKIIENHTIEDFSSRVVYFVDFFIKSGFSEFSKNHNA